MRGVEAYLVEQGIDPGRLVAKGYGPDKPIADNSTRKGRMANRRVEFRIIGKPDAKVVKVVEVDAEPTQPKAPSPPPQP